MPPAAPVDAKLLVMNNCGVDWSVCSCCDCELNPDRWTLLLSSDAVTVEGIPDISILAGTAVFVTLGTALAMATIDPLSFDN